MNAFQGKKKSEHRAPGFLLKQIYGEMLYSYPLQDVIEFWHSVPLFENGHSVPQAELMRRLWIGVEASFPLEFFARFRLQMESFLSRRGEELYEFMLRTAERFTQHPALGARQILVLFKPYFEHLFSQTDIRQLLLKLLNELYRQSGGHGIFKLVGQSVHYGMRRDTVLFSWGTDFSDRLDLDFENFILPILLELPAILCQPNFPEYKMLADMRQIDNILPNVEYKNGLCYSDGNIVGHILSFSEYAQSRGLVLASMGVPNVENCVILDHSAYDEKGGIVLHQGCLYNSPTILVEISYESLRNRQGNPLGRLVDDLITQENSFWTQVKGVHEEVLAGLDAVLDVVYYSESESISVNNHHITKNVPAKILRNILREYQDSGREEFENREFKRDPEIVMDTLNPNFEGRLNRLIQRLERENVDLSIQKEKRGKFRFVANTKVAFHEE